MRPGLLALSLACVFLTGGCSREPVELKLVMPRLPVDRDIATELAELLNEQSSVNVELVESPDTQKAARDALLAGAADLALVYNNEEYHPDISTVVPLYPTVFHIAHLAELTDIPPNELLSDHTVWAGPPGSVSRRLLEEAALRFGIPSESLSIVTGNACADVITAFAPIQSKVPDQLRRCGDYRLRGIGRAENFGKGSHIEGISLLNPSIRPFIIPIDTYDEITPEPIVTMAVDKLLVARSDLPDTVIYDLFSEVLHLQPALSHLHPGLFNDLTGDFDVTRSTFAIHPGALAFLERDAPSVYERYSGIAEVAVTLLIGLLSGGFALLRIYQIRRKNRIDVFYAETMAIRRSAQGSTDLTVRQKAIADVRALQNRAFEMLVDEKLAADESFRIFITLSNDVIQDLNSPDPVWVNNEG